MRAFGLVLLLSAMTLCLAGQPAHAQSEDDPEGLPEQVVDFPEGDILHSARIGPGHDLLEGLRAPTSSSLVPERTHFIDLLTASADDI
jgi:hypothetical protein